MLRPSRSSRNVGLTSLRALTETPIFSVGSSFWTLRFTNRKPGRRLANGLAPWVLVRAAAELAGPRGHSPPVRTMLRQYALESLATPDLDATALAAWYRDCLLRLRIGERPAPDWSIADRWIARQLLATGTDPALVGAVLRYGGPGFPRHHAKSRGLPALHAPLRRSVRAPHPPSLD
jgi:hypothetical protein